MHTTEKKTTDSPGPLTNNGAGKALFFQPKLTINAPGDQYEQEADRMAENVMRMPMGGQPFFKPSLVSISGLQRKCKDCEEDEKVQRKENSSQPTEASGEVSSYIGSLSSKGSPLPDRMRNFFEPRFGRDFSGVRIHNDAEAARSSQSVNALAYTVGDNIVFNQNQFSPETNSGQRLLAHELTHVVQQNASLSKMIQKADIPHGPLTWDDFQGTPPGSIFDAETFSNINYPDLTTIKPVITEKILDDDCDVNDGNNPPATLKKTEATIAMDSSGITVTSFMRQEKSWVKPLFKNIATMKAFCSADQPTKKQIADCTTYFSQGIAQAAVDCKPVLDDCKKNTQNGNVYTWNSMEANNDADCDNIFEACKKKQVDALKLTTGRNKDITSADGCSPTYLADCLEIRQEAADSLLSHEQGHFDITDVIAKKLETDIKATVDAFPKKTVSGCGHDEAQKLANDVVEKEVKPKINDKIKEAQDQVNAVKGYYDQAQKKNIPGKLRDTQDSYDTETTHGSKPVEQQQWKDNISKGAI